MDQKEFAAWEKRIAQRADRLWQDAGRPEGGVTRYLDDASMLIAIEENPDAGTLDPEEYAKPVIEESALMRNLGEFPTLTDQGEETTYPSAPDEGDDNGSAGFNPGSGPSVRSQAAPQNTQWVNPAAFRTAAISRSQDEEEKIRQTDGDASESGGVLPSEDLAEQDLPDISVADADITSDDTDADNEDTSDNDDINEDGLPDQPVFDR
jgi:Protein of unknown function (DUF2934)